MHIRETLWDYINMGFTLSFEITDQMVAEVQRVAKDYYQVNLKEADVEKLCRDYPRLIDEVLEMSISDTFPRGFIGEWLAEQAGFEAWPINGSPHKKQKAFYKKFSEKAVELGWIPEGSEIVAG